MSVSKTTYSKEKLLGYNNEKLLHKSTETHTFWEFMQNSCKYFLVLRKFLYKSVRFTPVRVNTEYRT